MPRGAGAPVPRAAPARVVVNVPSRGAADGSGVRVLIVDDERPARDKLHRLVKQRPEVEALFEAPNGRLAVDAVRLHTPDIMFLDIQMPDLDGFAVIEALPRESLPHVVFVTAYDQFALRAFEVHAVDYLLKPFDADRFAAAFDRALRAVRASQVLDGEAHVRRMLRELEREGQLPRLERLLVDDGERSILLPVSEVDWIEAHRNYVRLHARGRVFRTRASIGTLENRLDTARFVRISRSVIVALERVMELSPAGHGDYEVRLTSGMRLTMSRRYRERLAAFQP